MSVDEDERILREAQAAFEAGRIGETRQLLADAGLEASFEADLLGGVAARLEEDYPAALKLFAAAARAAPEPSLAANAWAETARVYGAMNDEPRSRAALEHALQINPGLAPAWVDRAALAVSERKIKMAEACIERARALGFEGVRLHEVLGEIALARGHYTAAVEEFSRARATDPASWPAILGTASVQAMRGEASAAKASLEDLFALVPRFPAYLRYAQLQRFEPGDPKLSAWIERLDGGRDSLAAEQREDLLFACAKALDDIGDYARAFDFLKRGNELHRSLLDYDAEGDIARRRGAWPALSGELLLAARRSAENAPALPRRMIFIVGMPRSGSTLIEQMLAGHSRIQAAGEAGLLEQLVDLLLTLDSAEQGGDPEAVQRRWIADLRERYMSEVVELVAPGFQDFIIDKTLNNFWYAGLIQAAFPEALVIHIKRAPMDVCFGCYRRLFPQSVNYSYDPAELAAFYAAYRERMAAWVKVAPGSVRELYYERLVEAPERELSGLLGALGLDYEEACLNFARSTRFVRTASQIQVREPLNRAGIGRWKHYEEQLAPLREALGEWPRRYAEELAAAG